MRRITIPVSKLLIKYREKTGLSQAEVAVRMGLSRKSGYKYISRLEKGLIKKSYLETVLVYLDAVGVNWITFFTELSKERDKQDHKNIMSSVKLPPDYRAQKQLDRDTRLYLNKIKPPQNFYTKVDMDLVKQKITLKVLKYLNTLRVNEKLIPHYLEFADKVMTADKYEPIIKQYTKAGVSSSYLTRIMNITVNTLHAEQVKVQAQKPITRKKAGQMAKKYIESRIKLLPVENAVNRLLAEHNLSESALYTSYMNFARECYRVIKRYLSKDELLMKQELTGLTRVYSEQGLNKEMAEKIKETVLNLFKSIEIT